MPHLREQLETALGPAYRFERELTGGGIAASSSPRARARPPRGGQVLAPDLTAGAAATGFARSPSLLKLQHPHIVPFLSAGESADLLYYIMPFVEGASLRAAARERDRLPDAEAVRLSA